MKSTAEQQEAKRKEKKKKLQIYRSTVAKIFEKVNIFYMYILLVRSILFLLNYYFLQYNACTILHRWIVSLYQCSIRNIKILRNIKWMIVNFRGLFSCSKLL